jgi:hypothetical protein
VIGPGADVQGGRVGVAVGAAVGVGPSPAIGPVADFEPQPHNVDEMKKAVTTRDVRDKNMDTSGSANEDTTE